MGGDGGDPAGFFAFPEEFGGSGDEGFIEGEFDEVAVCFAGAFHAGDDFLAGVATFGVGDGGVFKAGFGWEEAGEEFIGPAGDAFEDAEGFVWAEGEGGFFFAFVDEFDVVSDEVFVEAGEEVGSFVVGSDDDEVGALAVNLDEEFEFAFGGKEAGVDGVVFGGEFDIVRDLAVEVAFGIGAGDADAAAGVFFGLFEF